MKNQTKNISTEETNQLRANPPKLLRVNEAAAVVGVSKRTVERLIADKLLRVCRLGRRIIIRREDLFEYIESSMSDGASKQKSA